jgi:hypothetical protein
MSSPKAKEVWHSHCRWLESIQQKGFTSFTSGGRGADSQEIAGAGEIAARGAREAGERGGGGAVGEVVGGWRREDDKTQLRE